MFFSSKRTTPLRLSAILPRIDISVSGGEFHAVELITENRSATGDDGVVVPGAERSWTVRIPTFSLYRQFSLGLSGRQLIFDGGRWWKSIEREKNNLQAREADLRAMENLVRARVAQSFYGVERARQSRLTIQAQVDVDQAQVDRAEALLRAGRGAPADVATAQRNLASDRISLVATETAEGQARRTLNLQLGIPASTDVKLVMPPEVRSSTAAERFVPEVDRLHELTRRHRPELASWRAVLGAAANSVSIARADYWPTLAFEAQYNRQSRRPDRIVGNPFDNFTATVNVVMTWNLFQGFATNAAVDRALAQMRKSQAEYEAQERLVISQVDDSLQRYVNQQRTAVFGREQVRAAEEAVRLARGLYEAGRGTSLELRDAELGLTRARIATINARLDAAIAYSDLIQAVGTKDWVVKNN